MAYYIWHDEGCCDNREARLEEARRVQTALIADGHPDVYITDEDHNVVDSTDVEMQCADEGLRLRAFAPCGDGDYICRHCGWMQFSTAAGAAELCRSANWHDAAEYERYCRHNLVSRRSDWHGRGSRIRIQRGHLCESRLPQRENSGGVRAVI